MKSVSSTSLAARAGGYFITDGYYVRDRYFVECYFPMTPRIYTLPR